MTSQQSTTRRQRRIAIRKTQILDAAATIFSEKGYERATTREIAEAADVSEGTLYNYFKGKRAIFIGLLQDMADEVIEGLANIQVEGLEDMVAQLLVSQFLQIQKRRMFTLYLHEARLDPEINHHYKEHVLFRIRQETERRMQDLISAGIMRPVNPAIATPTLMGTMIGLAILFELGDDPAITALPPEVLATEVTEIFMRGLRARKENAGGGAS